MACDLITGQEKELKRPSDVEDHIFSKLPKPKRRFFNCDPFLLLHLFAVLVLGSLDEFDAGEDPPRMRVESN